MESPAAGQAMAVDDYTSGSVIDREAFGELYLRYRNRVYRYVRRLSENDDAAADLTALTFERALARLDTFRGDGAGFAPWLFRIARNQALDARRRRRPWIPLELLPLRRHPQESMTLEDATLRREAVEGLFLHLRELSGIELECLALRYGAGLTAGEIGHVIGKSDVATQKLMARALGKLKEKYRE